MKSYLVTYKKANGGIEEEIERIMDCENIIGVIEDLNEEFSKSLFPEDTETFLEIFKQDNYWIPGEFHDDVSGSEEWIYFDLRIKPYPSSFKVGQVFEGNIEENPFIVTSLYYNITAIQDGYVRYYVMHAAPGAGYDMERSCTVGEFVEKLGKNYRLLRKPFNKMVTKMIKKVNYWKHAID